MQPAPIKTTPTTKNLPVSVEVKTIGVYPKKVTLAPFRADALEQDLNFMASRYVEVSVAFNLLRAGFARLEQESNGFNQYPEGERGADLIRQAEAIWLGQSSDENGNPWKQQEVYRLLGSDAATLGVNAGLFVRKE
jgi:hypothetical protein